MDPSVILTRADERDEPQEGIDEHIKGGYAVAVGSLMYAAIGTPPDTYCLEDIGR